MTPVSHLMDAFTPPQDPVRPGRRPRFLARIEHVRVQIILVCRLERDVTFRVVLQDSAPVLLLVELVHVQDGRQVVAGEVRLHVSGRHVGHPVIQVAQPVDLTGNVRVIARGEGSVRD